MSHRIIKCLLMACVALLCLAYATQNVVNLDQAYAAVAYVLSRQDHAVYPGSFMPAVTSPVLVWAALSLIVALEFLAGVLAAKGSWDLFAARRADAAGFDTAKRTGLLGAGVGMLVWFGLFGVVGGAVFQMWQTPAGNTSLEGAFQFFGSLALVSLYVGMPEPR